MPEYNLKLIADAIIKLFSVLNILQQNPCRYISDKKTKFLQDNNISAEYIEDQLAQRAEAKKNRDFAKSDAIRDELLARGLEIRDTINGAVWDIKL